MRLAMVFPGTRELPASVGEIYEGQTSLDLVNAMQNSSMFMRGLTLDEYIETVIKNSTRMFKVKMSVTGKSAMEKADSFISELRRVGLAVEIKVNPLKK